MRRNARRAARPAGAGGGRVALRLALGLAAILGAVLLVVGAITAPAPVSASSATAPGGILPELPGPSHTACFDPRGCDPTPATYPSGPFQTPTPEATPTPPTPTPTPTPATEAPTQPPTPYAEQQIQASPSAQFLPSVHSAIGITPGNSGDASSLPDLAILAMVVLGVVAAASFFLFFRLR